MTFYEQCRKLLGTDSWMREQSASWAARYYPAGSRDVAARVMFLLLEMLAEDPKQLSPDSAFLDEIPLPELLDVELIMAVEEEFAINIPEQDAIVIRTVGELIEFVQKRLQANRA